MTTILRLIVAAIAAIAIRSVAHAAAWDMRFQQFDASNKPREVVIAPAANSLLGFGASKQLVNITAGSGLQISGNTLSPTGVFTVPITMASDGIRYLEGAAWAESAGFLTGRGAFLAQSATLNPAVVLLSATGGPSQAVYFGSAARGALNALTPTQAQDGWLAVFRSYGGSTWANSGRIEMFASGTHSETSRPSFIAFHTTPTGSTTLSERVRINPDGSVTFYNNSIVNATWAGSIIAPQYLGTGTSIETKFLRGDGQFVSIAGGGDALVGNPLSQFAPTTSAQLKGVLTDELGSASGKVIFAEGQLNIVAGKTLTAQNTLTLAGTDGSSLNVGAGGTLGAAAFAAFGTGSGTAAEGNDSRITGAVQSSAVDSAAERSGLGFATTTHGGLEERQLHGAMGATETFDLATANAHTGTLDANLTVTLTGFTAGKFCSMVIGLTQNGTGGWTVTWPAAVLSPPTVATTAGETTWVSLWSLDGGTTIYANSTADGVPNNAALAGSWNGDTATSPTRNAVHDAFAAIDADLDGKVDSIDGVSTAGLLSVNASGVPGQGRTITGTSGRISVTNGDGQSGNPTLDIGPDVVTKSSRLVSIPLTIDTIANSQNYGTFFIPAAFTVSKIVAVHVGTGLSSPSVIATIKHGTDRTSGTTIEAVTVTSSTTGTVINSGIDDPTIPDNSFVWIELSSRSGTTGNLEVYLIGTYD